MKVRFDPTTGQMNQHRRHQHLCDCNDVARAHTPGRLQPEALARAVMKPPSTTAATTCRCRESDALPHDFGESHKAAAMLATHCRTISTAKFRLGPPVDGLLIMCSNSDALSETDCELPYTILSLMN